MTRRGESLGSRWCKRRHALIVLAISLLLAGLLGQAAWGKAPAAERLCGLRLPSAHFRGVPAFAMPARGTVRARRLAGNWLRCTLYRRNGTRYALAYADARRRVLELRFFRRTGALLVSVDAARAASPEEGQKVSCDSAAQASISDAYWRGRWRWWIGATPTGLSADEVVNAVREAQREWTDNINWCGYADEADPPTKYMGQTDKKVGQDGQNTIDWGSLEDDESCAAALACTFTWYSARGKPVESDIRFDTASKWAIGGGTGSAFDIQSVAAHEFGHVYQFDHVTDSSRNDQTTVMWPYVSPGDTSAHKLGKGDAQADNAHY
jgi:hypothetical protein